MGLISMSRILNKQENTNRIKSVLSLVFVDLLPLGPPITVSCALNKMLDYLRLMTSFRCSLASALLLLVLLTGCKSADRIMFQTPTNRLSSQLPPLDIAVDNGPLAQAESDGALPDDPLRVFQQEASQNLIEPSDSVRFGYAKLLVTDAKAKRMGKFFQGLQMITLMIPSLLGLPVQYCRTEVKAEVQIINSHGEVIGTYAGAGRSKVRVAMYHGYSQASAPRLADMQALRLALDQIRPKLEIDADTLRQQLMAIGPIREIQENAPDSLSANQ